ncbi:hypothetical protein E2C01_055182 [Portunus trituberculatus]|uniref:Uncharacterized protein n=1 Tax=Portunus trituberculatus TaxID=210409 RepID=A0A5B7GVY0_PORTR|nr:hypothetical protein [Portunus trituberculatus]
MHITTSDNPPAITATLPHHLQFSPPLFPGKNSTLFKPQVSHRKRNSSLKEARGTNWGPQGGGEAGRSVGDLAY